MLKGGWEDLRMTETGGIEKQNLGHIGLRLGIVASRSGFLHCKYAWRLGRFESKADTIHSRFDDSTPLAKRIGQILVHL